MSPRRGAYTIRGLCMMWAGFAVLVFSVVFGTHDLLRVAVLIIALPFLAAALVFNTRFRLELHRAVTPVRVPVGQPAEVVLAINNAALLPTGVLRFEDSLPFTLGGDRRFTVDRIGSRETRRVRYTLRCDARGKYRLGPLGLRLSDPFGMIELTRSFDLVDHMVVTPVVRPLPPIRLPGAWTSTGDSASRSIGSRGEDDAAIREYRHGDDLRKVHWRSTARTGKFMVRQLERPRESRATVLVDTRARGHRGDGQESSFEWAVSAVASIGAHLGRREYALDLVTDAGRVHERGVDFGVEGTLLDYLAEVAPSRGRSLDAALPELRSEGTGALIAVLGACGVEDAEALVAARPHQDLNIALLVESATWVRLSPRAEERAAETAAAVARVLGKAGWRVVRVERGAELADVWTRAGERPGRETAVVRSR